MAAVNTDSYWYEDPELFLGWLSSLRESADIGEGTFSCYRKWLASYAEGMGEEDLALRIRSVGIGSKRDQVAGGNVHPHGEKDAEAATQRLPTPKEVAMLGRVLLSKRGKGARYNSGYLAFSWTQYMLRTGIRPSEWRTARLFPSLPTPYGGLIRQVIEVDCAKKGGFAYQEGNVVTRRLVLSEWTHEEYAGLQQFMDMLPPDEAGFEKVQTAVRKTLERASVVAFGASASSITASLYAFRHLFSDEVRREGKVSRYGLAAMMGHSDTVNQKWYGEKDVSTGRLFNCSLAKPWRPDEERVEAVDKARYKLIHANMARAQESASDDFEFEVAGKMTLVSTPADNW